jgi:outer membrane cobalamin receptor
MKALGALLLLVVAQSPAAVARAGDEEDEDEYTTEVVAKRPVSKDETQDALEIEGEELEDSPRGSTVEAISQESAGVYVTGRGLSLHGVAAGASGGITIRGLGGSPNSQILVVEDGVPDYQGIFGHPIPDAYVPFLIDKLLVIMGGDSVLYGTNAMGGVLLLTSRWRDEPGWEIENDLGYGSFATIDETASFLGSFGPWDLRAAFHVLDTDGHRDGLDGRTLTGQLGVRYAITPELSLTLGNKVVHLEGGDPGPATHPYTDHWYDVWRDGVSLSLALRHGIARLSVIPYLNVGVHRLYDGFRSTDLVGGGIAETSLRPSEVVEVLLGIAAEHVDGEVQDVVTGEMPDVRGLTNLSFYNQLTLRPAPAVAIVAGTRELYSTRYGFALLYKAGVRWEIARGLAFHTRISRNFRQPTIRELYLPFPTMNPDLRPEYSLNWDFGLDYGSEHVEISATGYRSHAENMIRYFGAWPAAEVVNIDEIVIWGVAGRVGLKGLGPVFLSVSGNWQDVGRYTRQNPDAKLDFRVGAGHDFGRHAFEGALTGEWVHGIYMANYGRQPLDDVFFLDLTLRYRFTDPARGLEIEPYVFLRNLADRPYEFIEGYPMPGFNVMVGLKVGI